MGKRDWLVEGEWAEYCSCVMGCPCETMEDPSEGHCTGVVGFKISNGHCDDVDLSGLVVLATFFFPRALHHGGGHMQPILESRANDAQRDALFYILTGEDQPVGTMFQIFSIIIEHHHDPVFTEIEWQWDIDKRQAHIEVPELVRARSETIRNPVTDEPLRNILALPGGWCFHEAENVAGYAKGIGEIKFDLAKTHSSLAYIAWDRNGMKYSYDESRKKFPLPAA